MKIIRARNVNQALAMGVDYLGACGIPEETRAGPALVSPVPVVTIYSVPNERVLFSAIRDANPFFHLAEAFWMLMGRGDAAFLNHFIRDFGDRFAEPDGMIHGAYGRRWRNHFINHDHSGDENSHEPAMIDQIATCIVELRINPSSRQVVLTMWDPEVDLGRPDLKDRPCNTHIYFRIREARSIRGGDLCVDKVLDMTVCCRSNDAIMGAYGANAVHFSILQEYVAAMVGAEIGFYYQMSNNFHVYKRDLEMLDKRATAQLGSPGYLLNQSLNSNAYRDLRVSRLVDHPTSFNQEMVYMINHYDLTAGDALHRYPDPVKNGFLANTLWPMLMAHRAFKRDESWEDVVFWADLIAAEDWGRAAREWLTRRFTNKEKKREAV